jgi:DNA-binding beta-propeller fold protein YncE/predicted Ser/Thr protein kinase
MPSPASTDPSLGSELLGYRIEELIGRGGMGVVFRARDQRLKRNVALKLLAPELASDEGLRERFLRESKLAASLDHPNVIPIYEAGEADGRLFIAMRYVEGGDLGDVLRSGPLEPGLALELCSQLAEALDAAHERGLVHRDVKPSNVLLDGRKHVYLADFGLTRRIVGGDVPGLEARSLGTIDYIAPEQIRGEEVDGRADLYSLGCLLYECLTGEPPFRHSSDLAVAFAHLEEEPPAPPELEGLFERALAKAPEDRYPSGHELVTAARAALGLDASHRRRWPLLVAAVVLALGIAGSLSFLLTRGGRAGASSTGRLLRIDARSHRVTGTVDLGSNPNSVAFGKGRVWVSTPGDSSVWRIEPKTLAATPFPASGRPTGVAISGGVVYVAEPNGEGVTMRDAATGDQLYTIPTSSDDGFGGPITSSRGGVWFVEELAEKGKALRLVATSPFAGQAALGVPIGDPRPLDEAHVRFDFAGVAAGAHGVWVAGDALDRRVFRIEPRSRRVVHAIHLPLPPGGIAAGRGAVWVTGQLGDVAWLIDPATNRIVQSIPVGREPTGVAVGAGSVWVANTVDRSISRIDPASNRVVETIPLKVTPRALTVADGAVWVAADAD